MKSGFLMFRKYGRGIHRLIKKKQGSENSPIIKFGVEKMGIENVQIVRANGVPVAAVLPWDEYKRLLALDAPETMTAGIPHDVVEMVVAGDTPVKAWRRYLGMTQVEAARKLGISQGAYAQIEKARKNQEATLHRIAAGWGIDFDQIDMV